MKWIILFLIFIGGIYYLINQKKQEEIKKVQIEQIKKEDAKVLDPELPNIPQNEYLMKFSKQTINTLRILTEDTNSKVRMASIELLWQLQDEKSPEIIKRIFGSETETEVKLKLIDMLSASKSKLSLQLLAVALKNYDKETRLKAAEAIGTFITKDAITILNPALNDYDEEVKLKALESINKIKKEIEQHREQKMKELTKPQPVFRIE